MFEVHKLNELGLARAELLRAAFQNLLETIEQSCALGAVNPKTHQTINGREVALARTHLETACFFAKRAMAMCPENQEP